MNERIQNDIKAAMLAKQGNVLNVLRAVKNEISNAALRKGSINETLTDAEIIGIIRKEISKRQDSIKAFNEGCRAELAVKEQLEIEILNQYLPEEMSDQELSSIVGSTIALLGATSKKDMGRVIKSVVEQANGRADNKRISAMVGELLQ
jgi:uncharacterized protein YqeY